MLTRLPTGETDAFEVSRHRLLHLLSALIDEGRLFFLNIRRDDYGQDKPSAYRGFTPRLMDCLKIAYLLLEKVRAGSPENDLLRAQLVDARRDFVSELQREVDPAWIHQAVHYEIKP